MAYHSGKFKTSSTNKYRSHPYRVSRVPRREVHRIYDKIYATIYGQCIGDALGLLTEGLNRDDVKKYYREVYQKLELVHKKLFPDAHRRRWKEADWTDETDQMILIIQSIAHNKCMVLPTDFARRLTCWAEQGFTELGDDCCPGLCSQIKSVITHPQFIEEPQKASEIIWRDSGKFVASNSAVARTAFLGLHQYDNLGQVIKNTLDICRVTHADPRCEASCVAVTTVLALMLQKKEQHLKNNGKYNVDALIDEAYMYASKLVMTERQRKELKFYLYSTSLKAINHMKLAERVILTKLLELGVKSRDCVRKELKFYLYCTSLKDLNLDEVGRTSYTYKALGAGFWALKQKDFRQAIQSIVLEGGDADANAAVAGALLGCKLGLDALPKPWFEPLIHRAWLDEIIDRYFDVMERKKREKETVV